MRLCLTQHKSDFGGMRFSSFSACPKKVPFPERQRGGVSYPERNDVIPLYVRSGIPVKAGSSRKLDSFYFLLPVGGFFYDNDIQSSRVATLEFLDVLARRMFENIKSWAEYIVEWAAKDPYGFLTTVILALTPLFLASAVLSWKLAKMIEAKEREQKKKQKRQENITKAKRTKKD
ncbi:putative UPF0542 C5orf43-like protein [Naja naja]|nr:putative UPF0542 C5orf43-like protein [Naja naja]